MNAAPPTAPTPPGHHHSQADACREGRGCRPLSSLEPGERASVCRVVDGAALRARLTDLGFVRDTPISVVRRAPLGDPLELEIRGTRLCLRNEEAYAVRVHPRSARP
jgi:Fe2+ transport system protein FeoA